jgi:hypothetical protein
LEFLESIEKRRLDWEISIQGRIQLAEREEVFAELSWSLTEFQARGDRSREHLDSICPMVLIGRAQLDLDELTAMRLIRCSAL